MEVDEHIAYAKLEWEYAKLCDDFNFLREVAKIYLKNEKDIGTELQRVLSREL